MSSGSLKQSFRNDTDEDQFITLELSTARYRLRPGEELILFYDPSHIQDEHGASLRTEFASGLDGVEIAVWTHENQLMRPDGTPAREDFTRRFKA